MRLEERQLEEVKDYILRQLPRVLEEDPRFSLFIEGLLSEKFPRRDEFARLLDEVSSLREEQRQRFEQMDQRFGQVDQRFGQMEQQFEHVNQRLNGISQDMRDLRDWVELTVGRLQTRSGRRLEDVVAGALRLGLQRPDIAPESIRMRQRISDPQGLVFKPGREREVDLVVQDSELLVFEVKSAPDAEDVTDFADKVELVRLQNPDKRVTGVLIVLGADEEMRRLATEHGLVLIP
ncbi:MAG: hypothetical protein ACUVWR_07425 [Anaerolineae bacterium]